MKKKVEERRLIEMIKNGLKMRKKKGCRVRKKNVKIIIENFWEKW